MHVSLCFGTLQFGLLLDLLRDDQEVEVNPDNMSPAEYRSVSEGLRTFSLWRSSHNIT
jgi:hypothetical protein